MIFEKCASIQSEINKFLHGRDTEKPEIIFENLSGNPDREQTENFSLGISQFISMSSLRNLKSEI